MRILFGMEACSADESFISSYYMYMFCTRKYAIHMLWLINFFSPSKINKCIGGRKWSKRKNLISARNNFLLVLLVCLKGMGCIKTGSVQVFFTLVLNYLQRLMPLQINTKFCKFDVWHLIISYFENMYIEHWLKCSHFISHQNQLNLFRSAKFYTAWLSILFQFWFVRPICYWCRIFWWFFLSIYVCNSYTQLF